MVYVQQVFYNQVINNLTATKTLGDLTGGSFTAGTASAWSTGASSGARLAFTSSTAGMNVTNLTATPSAPAITPTIVVTEGAPLSTETAVVTFRPLAAGQTIAIAGLTFTAGTSGATAAQLASAFSSIANNTAAAAINTSKTLNDAAGGTFTAGTSAAWASGVATDAAITFTSTSVNTNVANLSGALNAGTSAPTFVAAEGSGPSTTETSTVTFKALASGQTLTLAGLTFTAGANGATATQVASAFASINATAGFAVVNFTKTLNDLAGGTFTSGALASWSSGAATGAAVTFTSTTVNTNVENLLGTLSITASTPTITVTDGVASATTETASVTFQDMTAGQTLSIAGLTFTAGALGATAAQVATVFSNIAVGTSAASVNVNHFTPTMASAYVVTPGVQTSTTSLSGYLAAPVDGNTYTFLATGTFTVTANSNANTTISAVKGSITGLKLFVNGALSETITYGAGVDNTLFGVTDSAVTPPTAAIITAQRAQAALQYNNLVSLIDKGATFTGSDASNGGSDQVRGGIKNDLFTGFGGNDYFDGKSGIDTAIYRGALKDYTIALVTTVDLTDPSGMNRLPARTVTDKTANRDGVDTLVDVERLRFSDVTLALDTSKGSNAGDAYRLYKAAFDRTPDSAGLGFWIKKLDDGSSTLINAAQGFINSVEFINLNGVNSSNTTFVTNLYKHVLQRTPDADGYKYWDNYLGTNPTARAQVLAEFSSSAENVSQVANLIANGVSYTQFVG
jgi:hypothetical protein